MKVSLRGRTLPLSLTFYYDTPRNKDLVLYLSTETREPDEKHNQGI